MTEAAAFAPASVRQLSPLLLVAGIAAAAALRWGIGAPAPAASLPAAGAFIGSLVAIAAVARVRPPRVRVRDAGAGFAGAAVLVAAWWMGRAHAGPFLQAPSGALLAWTPLVVAVAAAEEAVLRGALFDTLMERHGTAAAVGVTTVVFAVLHVPLYGWGALPLDLAVGIWLAGLRLLSGSWAAPAIAHALADVAGGWLT